MISSGSCFLFLLNIIVGTGVFLNTTQLFFLLKEASYLAYIVTGFLMMPIICITYLLANDNPGFNLAALFFKYFGDWNKILVPLYALSKFATTVIGIFFISTLLKNIFFGSVEGYYFNILFFILVYLLCILLVYYDVSINYIIQKCIILFKLIPLVIIILFFLSYLFYDKSFFCYYLPFNSANESFSWLKLIQGSSITIFAFSGFESLFAINHLLIENKKKGAFLLGSSFLCAWLLYILYQFCMGNLAHHFLVDTMYVIPFASFLEKCFGHVVFASVFILLINFAIMVSSLGVAHGIMYVAVNNFYSSLTYLFGSLKKTKYFVFCLVPFYALIGMNNIFILQQFSSLGTIITYGLFVSIYYQKQDMNKILFLLGILSIFIFLFAHIYNAFYYFGFIGYIFYIIFFIFLLCLNFCMKGI